MGANELINRLEKLRKELNMYKTVGILTFVVLMLAPMLLGAFGPSASAQVAGMMPVLFVAMVIFFIIFSSVYSKKNKEFKQLYKSNFVETVLGDFFEQPRYVPENGFSETTVRSFGLTQMGNRFHSEDYLSGYYKGVFFEQSDVRVQYHTSGKNSHTTTYFEGRMFVFEFPKQNVLPIQVFSERYMYKGKTGLKMKKIQLESVDFNKRFDVLAADEHSAFYVLTPQLMEKISLLGYRFGEIALKFENNRLFMGVKCGLGAFDPDMKQPIEYFKEKEKMKQDIQVILDIIDAMELTQK